MVLTENGLINEEDFKYLKNLRSGNISNLSPLMIKRLQAAFGIKPKNQPPTIPTQPPPIPKPIAQPPPIPVSKPPDEDSFHNVKGRIQTTEPSLKIMPDKQRRIYLPKRQVQQPAATTLPLKMAQQSTLPLKMASQQPIQQTQQPVDLAPQSRKPTPQGLAALRGQPKWYPKGQVGKYKLEETLTEKQLKALIKEVCKILEK